MKTLGIIGASGHGKVVADIAKKLGYEEIVFFDDNPEVDYCGTYPVVGVTQNIFECNCHAFVAIGNPMVRSRLLEQLEREEKYVPVLVHPSAVVAEDIQLGTGTVVAAGAVINPGARIGKGCIINITDGYDGVFSDYVSAADIQIHHSLLPPETVITRPPVRFATPSSSQQVMSVCPEPMRLRT